MWTVAHSTVGTMIGTRTRRPWLAGFAAVFSHVLLDLIPHWDYAGLVPLGVWIILDQVSALLILLWMLKGNPWWQTSLAAAALAALPDLEGAFVYFHWERRYHFLSHISGFPHRITGVLPGSLVQVFIIVLSIFLILRQKNVLRSA